MQLDYFSVLRDMHLLHPHFPRYHFMPPSNLMNDPNGLIQWGDDYHMFYQYAPEGAWHGTKHWGHAVSRDLVFWEDRPVVLTPTPHSPDDTGCWSGSTIDWNGTPAIIYTGTQGLSSEIQTQCLATGSKDLLYWEKYPDNPIIRDVPAISGQTRNFRDPYVFRDGDGWSLLLASQIVGQGGVIFLYHSRDMIHWEYKHPLLTGSEAEWGTVFECPSFVPIGDRYVLIFSSMTPRKRVYYVVGRYENFTFTPETSGLIGEGCMYAPQAFCDAQGRALLFGWILEDLPSYVQKAIGWSGAMTLPRELKIGAAGQLLQCAPAEVTRLRGKHAQVSAMSSSNQKTDTPISGSMLQIQGVVGQQTGSRWCLRVLCHPDEVEYTDIIFDFAERTLRVDRGKSSEKMPADTSVVQASLEALGSTELSFTVFIDQSILEIFVNEQVTLTTRVYPARTESKQVRIINEAGDNSLQTLDVWDMQSIWEPVTTSASNAY